MDESEKRRERLKAMRMEAAQTPDFENPGLAPGALANPLIETDTNSASLNQYNTLPRFDYYTDPMSAFSGSKRMHNVPPQFSQGHHNTAPRPIYDGVNPIPAHHYPATNSPSPGPFGRPMGATSPSYRPQQNPPSSLVGDPMSAFSGSIRMHNVPPQFSQGHHNTAPRPIYDGMIPTPAHHYPAMNTFSPGPFGRPMGATSPSYRPQQNPPSSLVGYGGAFNYSPRPNFSRGRGRSYGNNIRPSGSGPSFGRGASSYYSEEMVKDPWLGLTPVLWRGVGVIDSDKSWLPKSIAMKKLKASSEAPQVSISQQSLAEYLAASFDDSVNEAVEDEKDT